MGKHRWRIGLLLAAGLIVSAGRPASGGEAGAGTIAADAAAVFELRDELLARLAERIDAVGGVSRILVLDLGDGIAPKGADHRERRGLVLHLRGAGAAAWAPGWGESLKYNKARHEARSRELRLANGRLRGELAVTIHADAWVPSDGKARAVTYAIDARLADGKLEGSFAAEGDFGTYEGPLTGTVEAAPLAGPDDLAGLPSDADPRALAHAASSAYRDARAAVRCLRHFPQDYTAVRASTALSAPEWGEGVDGAALAVYVARLRGLLEGASDRLDASPAVQRDDLDVGDPWFGPGANVPLAVEAGAAVLPDDVGTGGAQAWRFVPRWRLLAAFPPDPLRHLPTPHLPPLVEAPGARYRPDLEALGDDYRKPQGGTFPWVDHDAGFMQVAPPGQRYHPRTGTQHGKATIDAGVHGVENGRWFAAATVIAPRDVELHAAILADDLGKLTINGELVWTSGRRITPHAIAKLKLREGSNRILLECENRGGNSTLGLAFCVRGAPLEADERAALLARTAEASDELPPMEARGRHGDWDSRYPDADPPLAWDLGTGTNVRWRTELPDYSAAPPVVGGERVFVNCEPHTLYCLDRDGGEVLWMRESHVFEFVPEEHRAEAMAGWKRGWQVGEHPEVKAFAEPIATLNRRLRDDRIDQATRAEIEAEVERLEEEKKRVSRRLAGVYDRWCKELDVEEPGWNNNYGWTMGAPVTDGEHVWVKYATGVAACYTVDGERKWMAHTRLSGGVGNISSPLLLDGRFIVLGKFADERLQEAIQGGWPPYMQHCLIAFDAATGEELWKKPTWVTGGYGGPSGMVPLRLADGERVRELLLLGSGLVIDPADGRLLNHPRGPGPSNWSGDPLVAGNRAYFRRGARGKVVEYLLEANGTLHDRHVLTTDKGVYGQPGAALVGHHLYGNSPRGMGGQPIPWHQAGCVDVRTGEHVITIWPALRMGGLGYTPPASAGGYAVICGTGPGPHSWAIGPRKSAEIGFIKDGTKPYVASTCKVQDEAMVAAPVFAGKRMYLRTYRSAVCIEVDGDEGRALVDRHRAEAVLQDIPDRPEKNPVIRLAPPEDWQPGDRLPVEPTGKPQVAPQAWLYTGPLPKTDADPLASLGGAPAATPVPGEEIEADGATFSFTAVPDEHVRASKGFRKDMYDRDVYSARSTVDVIGAIERETPSTTFYFTAIRNDAERHFEVDLKSNPGQTYWLAGEELADDMVVRMSPGTYPLMVRVDMGRVPPAIKNLPMSFYLREVDDPDVAREGWLAELEALRPRLEVVVANLEPGPYRLRVIRYLKLLDGEVE